MKKCSRPLVTVDGLIVAFSETTKVSQDVKCNIQDKDEDSWLAAIQDGDLKAFLRDRYFRFSDAFCNQKYRKSLRTTSGIVSMPVKCEAVKFD